MKRLLLLICLSASTLAAQTAVLDDFSLGIRNNYNSNPLWGIFQGQGTGISASGGKLTANGPITNRNLYTLTAVTPQPSGSTPGAPYNAGDCTSPTVCAILTFQSSTDGLQSWNTDNWTFLFTFHNLNLTGTNCSTWTQYQDVETASPLFTLMYRVDSTHWWAQFAYPIDMVSCQITPGQTIQMYNNCANGTAGNSCGTYVEFLPGSYIYPNGFAAHYTMSGTFLNTMNRLNFNFSTSQTVLTGIGNVGQIADQLQVGLYEQYIGNTDGTQAGQHGYNGTNSNFYAGRTYYSYLNRQYAHTNDNNNIPSYPEDKGWYAGWGCHSFQCLTRFYFQTDGATLNSDPATQARWSGVNLSWSNFTWGTTAQEPDGFVANPWWVYSGNQPSIPTTGRYEVNINLPVNQGGSLAFRRSTSDMKVNGFNSGTADGSITLARGGVIEYAWHSADIAEAPMMYIGMRPTFEVGWAATGPSGDVMISVGDPNVGASNGAGAGADMLLTTGDHVTVTGVEGCTNANVTNNAVTVLPRTSFTFQDLSINPPGAGTLSGFTVANDGTVTVTTASAHGMTVGRLVQWLDPMGNSIATPLVTPILSVPTTTTFTYHWNGWPGGTHDYSPGVGGTGFVYVFEAEELNGTGACASSFTRTGSNFGTITSTDNTKNFTQLAIPAQTTASTGGSVLGGKSIVGGRVVR